MTVNIHTSTHTLSIILLVSTGGAVCVWVLGTAGDYIHPAAGSPRGEGGNVIYTLITRAPLNTPPDRCNILDISSSFFTPLFSLYSLPSASIPHTTPSPMLIFALLVMNTEQWRCRGAAVLCVCSCVCAECAKQNSSMSLSLFLFLSPQSSHHQNASSIHPLQSLLYINLFSEDGETNPAATPQYHLPWGIKGWLSCYCLSQ